MRHLTYMLRSVHLGFNMLGIAGIVHGTVQIGPLSPLWHPSLCKMSNLHTSRAEGVICSNAVAHKWHFFDIRCLLVEMQLANLPALACN